MRRIMKVDLINPDISFSKRKINYISETYGTSLSGAK